MNTNVIELLILAALGMLIAVWSYVTLSDSAGILFGFLYLMFIPVFHKGFTFFERAVRSAP